MDLAPLLEILKDESQEVQTRLRICMTQAQEYLGAERGCLMVTRRGRETMFHVGNEALNLQFPFSRNVVGRAMVGRTGLVSFQTPDALQSDGIASMQAHGVRAALCAPLLGADDEEDDLGIIYFDTRVGKEFTQEQLDKILELARAMGELIA